MGLAYDGAWVYSMGMTQTSTTTQNLLITAATNAVHLTPETEVTEGGARTYRMACGNRKARGYVVAPGTEPISCPLCLKR